MWTYEIVSWNKLSFLSSSSQVFVKSNEKLTSIGSTFLTDFKCLKNLTIEKLYNCTDLQINFILFTYLLSPVIKITSTQYRKNNILVKSKEHPQSHTETRDTILACDFPTLLLCMSTETKCGYNLWVCINMYCSCMHILNQRISTIQCQNLVLQMDTPIL